MYIILLIKTDFLSPLFCRIPWELHNQIQSKIHKVTGGLTRLASRTKVRKDDVSRVRVRLKKKYALAWMLNHVALVK